MFIIHIYNNNENRSTLNHFAINKGDRRTTMSQDNPEELAYIGCMKAEKSSSIFPKSGC